MTTTTKKPVRRRVKKKRVPPPKGYALDWAIKLNKLSLLPRVNDIIVNTGTALDEISKVNDYNLQSVLAVANHKLEEVLYVVCDNEEFVNDKQYLDDKLHPIDWYNSISLNLFKRFKRIS